MIKTRVSTKKLKTGLRRKKQKLVIKETDLLSTGSTVCNLACSGNVKGGLVKGHYYLIVGDSAAGKTILVLTILAEAANNPNFDNHRLIYDPVEGGALFDMRKFF